ncbi:InlB B-repeat-containing protein [Candidatus Saccharibacteria bacterium]|nr:InlB B-repeat-containing protein [Candidatus Saccharibacteria bacterium]
MKTGFIRKTNAKSINHKYAKVSILGALAIFTSAFLFSHHSAYAAFYANVSRTGTIKLSEEDGTGIRPSSSGTLGTGSDVVTINTNCNAGYNLYVSATSTGSTRLNLSGATSSELQDAVNYIAPSSNTPTAEGTLTKDTWGIGKTSSTFAGLQAYSADAGNWTPLYTATSTDISNNTSNTNPGTSTLTHNVYYGANISTAKTPGTYSGNVLYTVIMENACTEYTLKFDDGVDDSDTEAQATITSNLPNGIPTTETGGKGEYPKVIFGTKVNLSEYSSTDKIKRTGYTLKGWKIKVGNGTPSETTYSTTENMVLDDSETSEVTLIAQWEPNKYTIHYNSNAPSGTTASGTTADQTDQAYNATTTLRANGFSITGYNFAGWAYTANGTKAFDSNQASVSIKTLAENAKPNSVVDTNNATINLYALWTKASYTLTVSNGNSTAISSVSGGGTKTYGASVTVTCVPKTGYKCTGWTSSNTSLLPNSSSASYTFTMPAGGVTLTANGAANTYTLTVSNGNSTAISSVSGGGTKTYGASVTASCTPKSGYHCTGWTSSNTSLLPNSSNASYTFNMPAGAVTLTATGAANSFTIYYNSNGGSGTTASTTATYGQNVTLATNAFTAPSGKKFKEWNTSSDGNGTTYSSGQSGISPTTLKSNVTTVNGGSITLYAIWEDDVLRCSDTVHPTASTACQMADGRMWIIGNSGNTTTFNAICTNQTNTNNHNATCSSCPSGYVFPKIIDFDILIQAYGGTSYSNDRSGYQETTGALYKVLGLSSFRYYWSSTERSSSYAYYLTVYSGSSHSAYGYGKTDSYYVLCYK